VVAAAAAAAAAATVHEDVRARSVGRAIFLTFLSEYHLEHLECGL
jgi:hypothetical protein